MISISPNDQRFVDMAPLRIMSFDIECHSYGKLPLANQHQVITIGIVCKDHDKVKEDFKIVF